MARKRNLKPATVRYISDETRNNAAREQENVAALSFGSRPGWTVHNPSIARRVEGLETPDTRASTSWAPVAWNVTLADTTLEQRTSWTADSNADAGRVWDPSGRYQSVVYYDMSKRCVVERTYRNDADTEYRWERHVSPVKHSVTYKRVVDRAAYVDREREDYERTEKGQNVTRARNLSAARLERGQRAQ